MKRQVPQAPFHFTHTTLQVSLYASSSGGTSSIAAVAERLALRFVAERQALHEGGSATTHSTKINPVDITKSAIQLNSTGKQINTEAHRIERLPKLEHTTSIRRECPGTEKHELLRSTGGWGGSVVDPQI